MQAHPDDDTVGLLLDVSKAHKRVWLAHAGKRIVCLDLEGLLYYCMACHAGGACFPMLEP